MDAGDNTPWSGGGQEARALIVRVGNQYRFANLLQGMDFNKDPLKTKGVAAPGAKEIFLKVASEDGLLVEHNGAPDFAATILNALDRQARTVAEQFRYRVLHGAPSTSNNEWDGGPLDHGTTTSLARTEPGRVIPHERSVFGGEHLERARQLGMVYNAVCKTLTPEERIHFNAGSVSFQTEMETRYQRELAVNLLKATGIKGDLAKVLAQQQPVLMERFTQVIHDLATLSNVKDVMVDKEAFNDAAVVDVFHLLGEFPALWFAHPVEDHTQHIRDLLNPRVMGTTPERQTKERALTTLIQQFGDLYPTVMHLAAQASGPFYSNPQEMERSITARAHFENAPMDLLYRATLHDRLDAAVGTFRHNTAHTAPGKTVDNQAIREVVDKTVALSLRSVEHVLQHGARTLLKDGGVEVEKRTIQGVDYSVRGWQDGKRRLHLSIPLRAKEDHWEFPTLRVNQHSSVPQLFEDQLAALRYHFTTNGWQTSQEVNARVGVDELGQPCVALDIPVLTSEVGSLEGLFHCTARGDFWWHDGTSNFGNYTFAVPDSKELAALAPQAS